MVFEESNFRPAINSKAAERFDFRKNMILNCTHYFFNNPGHRELSIYSCDWKQR